MDPGAGKIPRLFDFKESRISLNEANKSRNVLFLGNKKAPAGQNRNHEDYLTSNVFTGILKHQNPRFPKAQSSEILKPQMPKLVLLLLQFFFTMIKDQKLSGSFIPNRSPFLDSKTIPLPQKYDQASMLLTLWLTIFCSCLAITRRDLVGFGPDRSQMKGN